MYKLSLIDKISFLLILIGGINWGLIALFNFNLVNSICGFAPLIERLVYILVGLAALNFILFIKKTNILSKINKRL